MSVLSIKPFGTIACSAWNTCQNYTLSEVINGGSVPEEKGLLRMLQVGWEKMVFRDVCAHCYCASLVPTLYMMWRVPLQVFQAHALSRNSTKYRADDLCSNLICKYFCWMLGDPHFFSADHFLF